MDPNVRLLTDSEIPTTITVRNTDYIHIITGTFWSGAVGSALGQLCAPNTDPITRSVSCISPFASWLIFPFKPHDGLASSEMEVKEKIARVSGYALGLVSGFFLFFFLNQSKNFAENKLLFVSLQIAVLSLNLFSCFVLRHRPTFTEKIGRLNFIKKAIQCFRPEKKIFHGKITITDDMSWREQQQAFIHNLKLSTNSKLCQIEKIKEGFQKIITTVNSDPDLKREFDIILEAHRFSLPKLDLSKPLNDETVEASRKACLELDYWIDLKKVFEECLQTNPEFKEKLYQKLNTP